MAGLWSNTLKRATYSASNIPLSCLVKVESRQIILQQNSTGRRPRPFALGSYQKQLRQISLCAAPACQQGQTRPRKSRKASDSRLFGSSSDPRCRVYYGSSQPPIPTPTDSSTAASTALQPPAKLLNTITPHENIYTIPNILTFTRLLAAPAVGYFILHSHPVLALSLFAYAGITDAVDGYLARKFNSQTVVGTVIDPMADKALMTIVVICLAVQTHIPIWLAVIILGRDVCLAISAIYFRWISLPAPKTFARYWDFSLPSAEVHPTEISKINTLLQLLLVGNAMVLPVLPEVWVQLWNLQGVFEGWQYLVAGTTVWSGLSYISNKDAVKILTEEEIERRQKGRGVEESGNEK